MRKIIPVIVKDGKVSHNTRTILNHALSKDGEYVVTIQKEQRTHSQNRFYWGVFIPEEIECFYNLWGTMYTKDEVHEWNKMNIWADEKLIGDRVIKTPTSSTQYDKKEWDERLETARAFFLDNFNWQMPYPDED